MKKGLVLICLGMLVMHSLVAADEARQISDFRDRIQVLSAAKTAGGVAVLAHDEEQAFLWELAADRDIPNFKEPFEEGQHRGQVAASKVLSLAASGNEYAQFVVSLWRVQNIFGFTSSGDEWFADACGDCEGKEDPKDAFLSIGERQRLLGLAKKNVVEAAWLALAIYNNMSASTRGGQAESLKALFEAVCRQGDTALAGDDSLMAVWKARKEALASACAPIDSSDLL